MPRNWCKRLAGASGPTTSREVMRERLESIAARPPRCRTTTGSEACCESIDGIGTPDEVFARIEGGRGPTRASPPATKKTP